MFQASYAFCPPLLDATGRDDGDWNDFQGSVGLQVQKGRDVLVQSLDDVVDDVLAADIEQGDRPVPEKEKQQKQKWQRRLLGGLGGLGPGWPKTAWKGPPFLPLGFCRVVWFLMRVGLMRGNSFALRHQ